MSSTNNINNINTTIVHKELDLIQSCISRMAKNSFYLKGWYISLIAVILALLPKQVDTVIVGIILFVITICIWYLNAFFLRAEKLYRELYNWVIRERVQNNYDNLYDLNSHRFDDKVDNIFKIMFRPTLSIFYLMPLLTITISFLIYKFIIIKKIIILSSLVTIF